MSKILSTNIRPALALSKILSTFTTENAIPPAGIRHPQNTLLMSANEIAAALALPNTEAVRKALKKAFPAEPFSADAPLPTERAAAAAFGA